MLVTAVAFFQQKNKTIDRTATRGSFIQRASVESLSLSCFPSHQVLHDVESSSSSLPSRSMIRRREPECVACWYVVDILLMCAALY